MIGERAKYGNGPSTEETGASIGGIPVVGLAVVGLVAGASAWALTRRRLPRRPGKRRPDMPTLAGGRGLHVERTVTISRSPDELYAEWRDLSRLPEVMSHVESVTPLSEGRSRWVVRGPRDIEVTWEAETVADQPGRLIAWRSVEGSQVDNAGSVSFTPAPGGRGTEVKVRLNYSPPGGRVGAAMAAVLGGAGDRRVREDLRRFKQRLEAGEVPTAARRRGAAATAGTRRLQPVGGD